MTDPKKEQTENPETDTLEAATERGYLGTVPDQTPNENYTVQGVAANAPTPETVEPGSEGSTKGDPDAQGVPETPKLRKA